MNGAVLLEFSRPYKLLLLNGLQSGNIPVKACPPPKKRIIDNGGLANLATFSSVQLEKKNYALACSI